MNSTDEIIMSKFQHLSPENKAIVLSRLLELLSEPRSEREPVSSVPRSNELDEFLFLMSINPDLREICLAILRQQVPPDVLLALLLPKP